MRSSIEANSQTESWFNDFKQELVGEFKIKYDGKIIKFTPINSKNRTEKILRLHRGINDFNELTKKVFEKDFKTLIEARMDKKMPYLQQFNAFINKRECSFSMSIHPLDDSEALITLYEISNNSNSRTIFKDKFSALTEIIKKHPLSISIYDEDGFFLEGNGKYKDLFGSYPPSDYTFLEDPIAKQETWWEEGIKNLEKGKPFQTPALWYDAHLVDETKPSKKICIITDLLPIKDSMGHIQNFILIHRDVSETEIARQELIESERKYERLFNTAPVAIWLVDSEGIIVDCNDTMDTLLSIFRSKDLIGKKFTEVIQMFMSKGDAKFKELQYIFKERFNLLVKGELEIEPLIVNVNRGDGKNLWLYIESYIVDLGKKKYFQIFIRDITEEQKTIKELEKERNTLKNIIELNPYAIQIFDNEGYCTGINKAFEDLYYCVPPSGYNFLQDPLHQKTGVDKEFRKVIEGEVIYVPENWYNPSDLSPELPSKLVCHNAVCFPIVDSKGNIEKIVAMYQDITERKIAQKKLEELKKELEERVKTRTIILEQSQENYKKAYNRATCFKGLFTHDINNMFQAISNAIELCYNYSEDKEEREKILEYYRLIQRQIDRGKRLIQNIQNLSEIEKSEMKLEPKDLIETLQSAINFTKNNNSEKKLKITVQDGEEKYHVLANDLLLDVFENILINAINYSKEEEISVIIKISDIFEEDADLIKIEFEDNGIGVPDTEKKQIFNPSSKKENSKGMGLGLSLISRLLALWNGKIWVEDKIKGDHTKGSNFIILIPKSPN